MALAAACAGPARQRDRQRRTGFVNITPTAASSDTGLVVLARRPSAGPIPFRSYQTVDCSGNGPFQKNAGPESRQNQRMALPTRQTSSRLPGLP
jgi:hypothetical protein